MSAADKCAFALALILTAVVAVSGHKLRREAAIERARQIREDEHGRSAEPEIRNVGGGWRL